MIMRFGENFNLLNKSFRKNYTLYLFLLVPVLYFIIFKYIPMAGNVLAFRKYVPGQSYFGVKWEGFKYFEMFLQDPQFWNAFKNTLVLSFVTLLITFPLPIIFSLFLNEINGKYFKKVAQSVTIIPKFLSAVVVIMILNTLLSPSNGIVNLLLEKIGIGSIYFLNEASWFRPVYIVSEIWQFLGWNSIIYMAVLASADQQQYEAAMVDGASRLQQTFHITMPLLLPTIAINLIIAVGNILNLGFEKILLMYTPSTYDTSDIIQTFVYRIGLIGNNFSYGTAVGLFQSVISLLLLWMTNKITKKYWGSGLW
ncbi:sugar ABC transporter permease [Paenibacillus sp. 11B]|uniref:ABC transporter permease n=1 Tax=Paenibacillus sp. 11B TaxID=3060965 RepID=UPI0026587747|nr:ABC transporter permease subunit [Paenibacillus sp. 11B]